MENLKDKLIKYFEGKFDNDLLYFYNQYLENTESYERENEIYEIETFFISINPCSNVYEDVICRLDYDNFKSCHEFVKYSDRGFIISTDWIQDWIDIEEIVDYILDKDDDLDEERICELLNAAKAE
jgi:hypothetical protein